MGAAPHFAHPDEPPRCVHGSHGHVRFTIAAASSRSPTMKLGTLLMAGVVAAAGVLRRRQLTTTARVGVIAAVAALVVAGSGVVHLPSVQEMVRVSTATLGELTYLVVGACAFAESGAFVGLIAPGEIAVLLGGVSAGHGTIALPVLIVVVWACAFTGDLVSYGLGRRYGREVLLRHGRGFGVTERRLERVEGFLTAHPSKTILVGRFIGLVRTLAPFVAGASGLSARRFVPAALVASGVWAGALSCLGYAFWESLDTLVMLVERGSLVLAAAAAVILALRWTRRRAAVS